MIWLLARLGLNRGSPVSALASVVAGGGVALALYQNQPKPADAPAIWAFYWIVIVASVALAAHGLLTGAFLLHRSGRLAWAIRSRLRFRLPVYLTPGGSDRPAMPEYSQRLQRAVNIAITWLYRRQNWAGLSHDGRYSEPAPESTWGQQKYGQLGLAGLLYQPPAEVPAEPGWEPGDRERPTPEPASPVLDRIVARMLPMPPPPASEGRPPLAMELSRDVWANARPEFCGRLTDLIAGAEGLTSGLQAVATSAGLEAATTWQRPVGVWLGDFRRFAETYYGSISRLPTGDRALPPEWRQQNVTALTSRLAWLRAQRDALGCKPS
jgi:hypothetical protein